LIAELRSALWYGFLFTAVIGTILHFIYDWSGQNPVIGLFAPVNESVWEHLKMLYWPMSLFGVVEYRQGGYLYDNFLMGKALGVLGGMLAIVVIFYTYTGILGRNSLPLDVLTFYIGTAIGCILTRNIIADGFFIFAGNEVLGATLLVITAMLFMLFTYNPPNLGIFQVKTKPVKLQTRPRS